MKAYQDLKNLLQVYLPSDSIECIDRAYEVAKQAHEGQFRHSGEPYIIHPIAVAHILAQYRLDSEIICACLLHDVLEDTHWRFDDLAIEFGTTIATLVDGVSKLRKIEYLSRAHQQAENLWKMMLAIAQDLRVIVIKLADRLHNMRTLDALHKAKRCRKALETLEIYAPIAARIGMHEFKKEFEKLGFSALYPMRARVLEAAIERKLAHSQDKVHAVMAYIEQEALNHALPLVSCLFIKASVYDIYVQMKKEKIRFHDVNDFGVLEIICPNSDACYQVLGRIHQAYRPLIYRFRDYIALPKSNGYQSLHTNIILSNSHRLEIHIRSQKMDHIALRGVASESEEQYQRVQRWIGTMIQARHEKSTSIEFAQQFKEELHRSDIYFFDEKGDIWSLPLGSTAIDFAYLYNLEQAPYCCGVRINNRSASLSRALRNGQIITLSYGSEMSLDPSWLMGATSSKARAHIYQSLRIQKQKEAIILGETLFLQTLKHVNLELEQLIQKLGEQYWEFLGHQSAQSLFLGIGMGTADPYHLIHTCFESPTTPVIVSSLEAFLGEGGHSLMVPATCCYPTGGDRVRIIPSATEGWTVHKEHCSLLQEKVKGHPSFLMDWKVEQAVSLVDVEIFAMHQFGVLAQITQVIAQLQSNIQSIYSDPNLDRKEQKIRIRLTVRNRDHLLELLSKIRNIPFVSSVQRIG